MSTGYNKRIRAKLEKLDGDFEVWHYAIRQLAYVIKNDSSRSAVNKALAKYKTFLRFNNNSYYKATKAHHAVAVAENWNKCMAHHLQ